jgi:signal transduction histidine kinase
VSGKAVGRSAAALPWLCPNTDGLIRLAEEPAGFVSAPTGDPALLALLLRFAVPTPQPDHGLFCPVTLASATLPEVAAALLSTYPGCWVVPTSDVAERCRSLTARTTVLARRIAEHTRRACAERAAAAAALAPLGWLAVAAVDPGAAAAQLATDLQAGPRATIQADAWGLDQNAIARRLANRWRFPDWLANVLGNLNLPLGAARAVVTDPNLFAVVQLALVVAEESEPALGLTRGAAKDALVKELHLDLATLEGLHETGAAPEPEPRSVPDPNPSQVPLVENLLRMSADARRRNGSALVGRLEDRLDHLHGAIGAVGTDAEQRVRNAKLAALAELAAGAGHEINNPLAIISGNAQRLFRTEPDPDRGQVLQTILRQTQRIAGLVRDLMQFARPPRPAPRRVAAAELLAAVREELAPFAAEKGAGIALGTVPADAFVRCDWAQLKHVIAAVARNGIEAAGANGWVRLSCTEPDEEFIHFVVEDSGPGLSGPALEHCFDPFYCGRSAGRGRGLGLSTAWQLARQNGGEVRHERTSDGPTRFVVVVPRSITLEFLDRRSA